MSPRNPKDPRKPSAAKLRWVGTRDEYVAGVPLSDLDVVQTPVTETQVTPERARELVATRLYVPEGGDLPQPEIDEGAVAPEEDLP